MRRRAIAAAALVLTAVAACGDSGSTSSSITTTRPASSALGADVETAAAPSGSVPASASAPAGVVLDDPSILRAQAAGLRQIYTGAMQVEVKGSVFDAALQAKRLVTDAGGYVFSERSVRADNSGQPTSEITFKIPPERFTAVLDTFARTLGTERGRQISADDVTAQFVDLTARLKTAEVSLERVRLLLADAKSVTDILTLEGEVAKRETQVEQLQGQLNQLSARVDYATVTLTLAEKIVPPKDTSNDIPSPLDGLQAGAGVFLRSLQVVILVLAVLLPFAPLFLLAWWLGRRMAPRLKRWFGPVPQQAAHLRPPSVQPPPPAAPTSPSDRVETDEPSRA